MTHAEAEAIRELALGSGCTCGVFSESPVLGADQYFVNITEEGKALSILRHEHIQTRDVAQARRWLHANLAMRQILGG